MSARSANSALNVVISILLGLPVVLDAQRGRGASGEKPKVDVVQTVGCVERKSSPGDSVSGASGGRALVTWWLTRAAEARVVPPGLFNTNQVEAARKVPLGSLAFQLVGVADFLTPEELLESGQRKEFTTPETANATAQLRHGHQVLVKGMLIQDGDQKRINLLSVVALADSCR